MPSLNSADTDPQPSVDIAALRRQLARQSGRAYWRSLEELAGTESFTHFLRHEFPRLAALWEAPVDRRQALKLMAASMALAGVSACGRRQPPELILPYVNMPENQVPGIPLHYASALALGGYAEGILAETYEGRPVKIEGNPDHPASLGGSNVFMQAALLGLYDPERSQALTWRGEVSSYGRFLGALNERRRLFQQSRGAGLCILTEALSSPSQVALVRQLLETWPGARWFAHDTVSRRNAYQGAEWAFGRPAETLYRFERAEVVVSLDGDFLSVFPGHLRYARDFISRRRLRDGGQTMNRLYVAESTPTITGASADHRLSLPATAVLPLACILARRLGLPVPRHKVSPAVASWIARVAEDLMDIPGESVVLTGDHQPPAVHTLVQAINLHLRNTGRTLVHTEPILHLPRQGLRDLSRAIADGQVHSLLILGANPVYTAPAEADFATLLPQVPFSVHWGEFEDETGRACTWHLPAAHPLESWDDARAFDGTASLIQPLLRPLYGGLTAQQVLTAFTQGVQRTARELLFDYWRQRYTGADFDFFRKRALQKGVIEGSAPALANLSLVSDWTRHLPTPASLPTDGPGAALGDGSPPPSSLELQLRPDPSLWDGRFANNGWLQELPKPLTKLTWGNAALIAPALAEQLQLSDGQIVELSLDGRSLEVPVWIQPGQPAQSVLLHLGHGGRLGQVGNAVGVNAYPLQPAADRTFATGLRIRPTRRQQVLASTQHHHSMEGRDLVREATLEVYRENPAFASERPAPDSSLYPPSSFYDKRENAWGMVIDLNACIGCNACVIACQAENNIPVVGGAEVERGHALHWLRVDRYFTGPPDAPGIRFQPVPCMHCEKAPCESVCPVEATLHDRAGLNEMIYNRCIGTRYCSQNCPYKVRRFNWFHYTGGPYATPAPAYNPEVTVRSRGVMEKCTYCVQRISRARQEAKSENRPLREGDIQTACQQACPTRAILFGDIDIPGGQQARLKQHPLNYALLADLNTRPRTTYLAGVRNPHPALEQTLTLMGHPNWATEEPQTTEEQWTKEEQRAKERRPAADKSASSTLGNEKNSNAEKDSAI